MERKLNILIISLVIPYPLNSGGNLSQFAILELMQHNVNVTLCLRVLNEIDFNNIELLKERLPNVNFKIIDEREISNSEPETIIIFYLKKIKIKLKRIILKNKDYNKNINQIKEKEEVDDFDIHYKINPVYLKTPKFCSQLNKIVYSQKFDLIQTEFYECIDLVNLLPADIPSIFIHHEIRYERIKTAASKSNKEKYFTNYIYTIIKLIETTFLNKYNTIITFSDIDKRKLNSSITSNVVSIPFPILEAEFYPERKVNKINKIIFVGAEHHYPNYQGVIWFISKCFEHIWEKYEIPLVIIGQWSESSINKYAEPGKIAFTGFIEDMKMVSENAISISPIHIGSGIRTKILYAMANKTPVISTTIGVEGIEVYDKKQLMIADDAIKFTQSIEQLIEKPDFANELANNAFNFVKLNFNQRKIVDQRIELYNKIAL